VFDGGYDSAQITLDPADARSGVGAAVPGPLPWRHGL